MSIRRVIWVAVLAGAALNCGGKPSVVLPPPLPARVGFVETGVASWYGHPYHGRTTSNGETYDMEEMTAAHTRLPFDTVVRVTNLETDRAVEVRINDRGPFIDGRIIDLSRAAARQIDMIGSGIAKVRLEVVSAPGGLPAPSLPLPARSGCLSQGHFGAQVGSFADRDNAERMRGKMELAYGEARIYQAATEQAGLVYRVVVGSASRSTGLQDVLDRLRQSGVEAFVQRVDSDVSGNCV